MRKFADKKGNERIFRGKKREMRSGREKMRELELFGDTDIPITRI